MNANQAAFMLAWACRQGDGRRQCKAWRSSAAAEISWLLPMAQQQQTTTQPAQRPAARGHCTRTCFSQPRFSHWWRNRLGVPVDLCVTVHKNGNCLRGNHFLGGWGFSAEGGLSTGKGWSTGGCVFWGGGGEWIFYWEWALYLCWRGISLQILNPNICVMYSGIFQAI